MSFAEWVRRSRKRFETEPAHVAAVESARKFGRGIIRRTVDPHVGRSIWERDGWDVLLVLDACRTDLWRDVAPEYDLPSEGEAWSNGSCSIDWIKRNFTERPDDIGEAGYVSANPFADNDADHAESADLSETPIGHFRPLYRSEWAPVDTDPPIETVPPERVTDHAIDVWRRRRELGINQLVVHYMQPHEPFIARPEWSYQDPHDNAVLKNLVTEGYRAGSSPWQSMVNSGEVSPEEFWPVYCDNLRWVLNDVVERLLENVNGEVVFTADHGNGLGEWGCWHHPPAHVSPAVRRVPWVPVEAVDRRTVTPDVEGEEHDDRAVTDQLEALGYR